MSRLYAVRRILFCAALLGAAARPALIAQTSSFAPPSLGSSSERSLLDLVTEEEKRGTYVFYNQRSANVENQRVSFNGSLYGALSDLKLEHCRVQLEMQIVDSYSGERDRPTMPRRQERTSYNIAFQLTQQIARDLEVVDRRPYQLRPTTNAQCEERPGCELTWIKVQAKDRVIDESTTTNGILSFHGSVDQFLIPVSSSEAGAQLVGAIRDLAAARCPEM